MHLTRRSFFAVSAAVVTPSAIAQTRPPALPADLVKEFVIAGHGNLERVKELLEREPGLLNASWDWGGGDFESALEGAGHMGNREIALYLIGKGARMSIFQAAMLGQLDVVKAILAADPSQRDAKGPHGIPLLVHAEKGGAEEVVRYLKGL